MIPVSIEGVRRNFGISSVFMYSVFLIDESSQRIFVFGIERQEALPIVTALHDLPLPRPQAIDVMVDTLKLLNTTGLFRVLVFLFSGFYHCPKFNLITVSIDPSLQKEEYDEFTYSTFLS
jgi:hypothetical protein